MRVQTQTVVFKFPKEHETMTTKPTTPEKGNTSSSDLGVFDTHALMSLLFTKARPHLNREELAWIAGGTDVAVFHARNLAKTMTTIGCMTNQDEGNWMEDSESVSKLLFGLAHQTHVIAELVEMAESARCWLRG